MIDDWINNGSGWTIESIESQYINISTYRPLAGSSYIDVPIKTSKKKINQHYGVMLGILIRQKSIQKKFKKLIKDLLVISIMMELSFL